MKSAPTYTAWLVSAALCLTFLLPVAAGAQGEGSVVPRDVGDQFSAAVNGAGVSNQEGSPEIVIMRLIRITLSLIGVLLVAFMVYAGYLWMTAAGNEEQVTKAKDIIRNVIIGAVIVFSAYAISSFVVNRLIYATRGQ